MKKSQSLEFHEINGNDLQSTNDGLQPNSDGLQPRSDGLQLKSDDLYLLKIKSKRSLRMARQALVEVKILEHLRERDLESTSNVPWLQKP